MQVLYFYFLLVTIAVAAGTKSQTIPDDSPDEVVQSYLFNSSDGDVILFGRQTTLATELTINSSITLSHGEAVLSGQNLFSVNGTHNITMEDFQLLDGYTAFTMTGGSLRLKNVYVAMRYFIVANNASISISNTSLYGTDFLGTFEDCSIDLYSIYMYTSCGISAINCSVVAYSVYSVFNGHEDFILDLDGGSAVMTDILIEPDADFTAVVLLQNAVGQFTNFTIRHFPPNNITNYNPPRGFMFYNSTVLLDNVQISVLVAYDGALAMQGPAGIDKGAAFYFESSNGTMRNSRADGCAGGQGGAMYLLESNVTVENCTFNSNTAFSHNYTGIVEVAQKLGGAIYIETSELYVFNSFFSNNSAYQGGVVYVSNSLFILVNSTLSTNIATLNLTSLIGGQGGAIYISGDSTVFLSNNTIVDNSANTSQAIHMEPGPAKLTIYQTIIEDPAPFLPLNYCCNAMPVQAPSKQLCSYPSCDASCPGTKGCTCSYNSEDYTAECPCRAGYLEVGLACFGTCGNGSCDAGLGENCVSCPLDCKTENCGICGDGHCDAGETCANCFEDCRQTCGLSCTSCSEHGECVLGTCTCATPWTGPTCSALSQPITVVPPNASTPLISIQQSSNSFLILLKSLREIDLHGDLVGEVDLRNVSFALSHSLFPDDSAKTKNQIWQFGTTLDNQATVNVTFIDFADSLTTYLFYNETKTFPANTVKMNVKIANWPFVALSNSLQVVIESEKEGGIGDACLDSQTSGPTLTWTQLFYGDTSLYTQFESDANVDGRERSVTYVYVDQFSIAAQLPHFWAYAEMDPDFSVLVNVDSSTDKCGHRKTKNHKTLIIAVVVSVIGVALIVVVVYSVYRRKRYLKSRRQMGVALTRY